jgi:hypothetical protein
MLSEIPKRLETATLPPRPSDWPWALPHIYAVDTLSEPGDDVVGYSARKDGTGSARTAAVPGRTRVAEIGYWNGRFAILWSGLFLKENDAERVADAKFRDEPIRFRMKHGAAIRTNEKIEITGKWPETWVFHCFYDLGCFCAFLYAELKDAGLIAEAEKFKSSLHPAMPGSELFAMFQKALGDFEREYGQRLGPNAQVGLNNALALFRDSATDGGRELNRRRHKANEE